MSARKLTPEELHILQHSLGVDKHGQGRQYRNYYCVDPGCDGFDSCMKLVADGFMRTRGPGSEIVGGMHTFHVTPAGIDAVAFQSPPAPKLTRSQQRYRDYLREDGSWSFGEWLKFGGWKKPERLA